MTDRMKIKKMMRVWIALGAIAIILGYGAFRAKNLAEGPQLDIASPLTGSSSAESKIEVRGTTKNISFLKLNGNKIFTDELGMYKENMLLSPGYNVVTLEAWDRFGRMATKTLQLTYK